MATAPTCNRERATTAASLTRIPRPSHNGPEPIRCDAERGQRTAFDAAQAAGLRRIAPHSSRGLSPRVHGIRHNKWVPRAVVVGERVELGGGGASVTFEEFVVQRSRLWLGIAQPERFRGQLSANSQLRVAEMAVIEPLPSVTGVADAGSGAPL